MSWGVVSAGRALERGLVPIFESTNSAKVHVDPGCAVFPKNLLTSSELHPAGLERLAAVLPQKTKFPKVGNAETRCGTNQRGIVEALHKL